MDIERYKRLAIAKVRAGRATKAVRDTLKDVEYSKQDQYEERGEMFKPVIDSQMEIKDAVDKKQDELIKRLLEGQDEIVKAIEYDPKKAITYEGKKLPELMALMTMMITNILLILVMRNRVLVSLLLK